MHQTEKQTSAERCKNGIAGLTGGNFLEVLIHIAIKINSTCIKVKYEKGITEELESADAY